MQTKNPHQLSFNDQFFFKSSSIKLNISILLVACDYINFILFIYIRLQEEAADAQI